MFISKECKDLGQAIIDTYADWKQEGCVFVNKNTRDGIWTASGVFFIELNGHDAFGIFEKYYINRCIQKAKTLKILGKK